jgi:hypothetical protein
MRPVLAPKVAVVEEDMAVAEEDEGVADKVSCPPLELTEFESRLRLRLTL